MMSVEQWVNLGLSLVVAGLFLYLGGRGLVSRRPLLCSARWMPTVFGLILARQLTPLLGSGAELRYEEVASPSLIVMLFALVLMFWFSANGYIVFGATEQYLRSALHHALDARGLAREDRPGTIHLPSEQLDIQLQLNEAAGTATVKVAPARGKALLRELGSEMQRFFANRPIALRKNLFVVYTYLTAILVGVAALYMW